MSFNTFYNTGSKPIGLIDWPGTIVHKRVLYISPNEPEKKDEKKEHAIPPHLIGEPEADVYAPVFNVNSNEGKTPLEVLGEDFFKRGDHDSYIRKGDLAVMNEALQDENEDLEGYEEDYKDRPDVKSLMLERMKDAKREILARQREFVLKAPAKIHLLMDPDEAIRAFIVGCSKSGKSTIAAELAQDFARIYPDQPIFGVSAYDIRDDPAFAKVKSRIINQPIDETFCRNIQEGKGQELADCLVIFDDIDSFQDLRMRKIVQHLRGHLLDTGRKRGVYVICTSQVFRGGEVTKAANNQASFVVVFPGSGNYYHITNYLKEYCGFTKEQIERVMNLKSRWVKINKERPIYVLHEHGGYFVEYSSAPEPKRRRTSMFEKAGG